jgi:PKD repeat protein
LWSYYDGSFEQVFTDSLERTFSGPGEHLVCLTANAYDLQVQQPCSTTTCRLVDILQDPSCADLEVDFTIATVDGQTITFAAQAEHPNGIAQWAWDFGDASLATVPGPQHTFSGNGPHEVCLTATTPPPIGCTGTRCQWLYLGPAPVPCDLLFTPGFLLLQYENFVGVMDTSVTSGMNSDVAWSFGDGALALGRFAIHSYAQDGVYDLCSTVRFWGPLLTDTCTNTTCNTVWVAAALGVNSAENDGGLRAWPVPFSDALVVEGAMTGPVEINLFDGSGRVVHKEKGTATSVVTLRLGHLAPGSYILQLVTTDRTRVVRVARE